MCKKIYKENFGHLYTWLSKIFQSNKDSGESISKLRASSLTKLIENTQFIMIFVEGKNM